MSSLVIPIDASQVPEAERGQQKVKVAAKIGDKVVSQIVAVSAGKAEVKLDLDPKQPATIAVGPENVSDEEIFNLQTITYNVSPAQWAGKPSLTLPIIVNPYWWYLWLRWCRVFVIQGRVVCANGKPVPGAEVRAYDVDFFWWWSSVTQVGPVAVTDANGHFAMKFRWCCGWWPWWWWRLRTWSLEPLLIDKILPALKLNPNLRFRSPSPQPTADVVNVTGAIPNQLTTNIPPITSSTPIKDPTVLSSLRDRLTSVLPKVPDLERLRIWPWWPWTPWLDCSPDIIFKVTQDCGDGQNRVIVNENIFQTRWDIPTNLNVTLLANDKACCGGYQPPDPLGDCAAITAVCGYDVDHIGGNPGAAANPVGYADPGGADRPFSEWVNLRGLVGISPQTDFYEIEFSPHSAGTWNPVPGITLGGFNRRYFDGNHTGGLWNHPAPFPVISFGGKFFYESRHHYEASHPPPDWGGMRVWLGDNYDLLAPVSTANNFVDGNYDFRVVGYKSLASGDPDIASRKVLDGCGVQPNQNNLVVIRLDNRIASGPPPGTVHVTTTEPDCGIVAVRLGGVGVLACGSQELKRVGPPTPLEIDFFVTDNPIGADINSHLDEYTLVVKYDISAATDMLHLAPGTFTLSCISGGQAGETYGKALAQGAVRPSWAGGTMRLHINDALTVFPKTCCYLLELVAYKRNVINCSSPRYYNQSHYSFTVIVV